MIAHQIAMIVMALLSLGGVVGVLVCLSECQSLTRRIIELGATVKHLDADLAADGWAHELRRDHARMRSELRNMKSSTTEYAEVIALVQTLSRRVADLEDSITSVVAEQRQAAVAALAPSDVIAGQSDGLPPEVEQTSHEKLMRRLGVIMRHNGCFVTGVCGTACECKRTLRAQLKANQ